MEFVVCGVLLSDVDKRREIPKVAIIVRERSERGRRSENGNFLRVISVRWEMGESVAIGRREYARWDR